MPFQTCRHIKEDGAYCGSPSLHDQKYCYYHLLERGRRLRRARALRDNRPYRFQTESLDNLYAVRNALTEVYQAVGAGQLEPIAAGKMLYALQQVTSINRRIEQQEAAAAANEQGHADDTLRVQEYPGFEKKLGLPPGADLDAEIDAVLCQAAENAVLRQPPAMPPPPAGVRPGSAAYHVYREESYQALQAQLRDARFQLRDYHQQKRQQFEEMMKKEVASAVPASDHQADTA
jgi:hypothetical protein